MVILNAALVDAPVIVFVATTPRVIIVGVVTALFGIVWLVLVIKYA